MGESIETVVVGAGQAGLCMAWHLRRLGCEHVVLERGRLGERWRSERWDSLRFQFPNWMMRLPGHVYDGGEPDAFMGRDGVVRFLESFARGFDPPIRSGVEVLAVRRLDSGMFAIVTRDVTLRAANVVVATGPYQLPRIPACSAALSPRTAQVASNRYVNASLLPQGGVLVVGGGSSGYQIAEDLARSGRRVYLSVRRHRRVPRCYRGRDFGWWQETMGALDRIVDSMETSVRAPVLTGIDGGEDADFRRLARRGVTLVGSLLGIEDGVVRFAEDLHEHLAQGDAAFDEYTQDADRHALECGLDVTRRPVDELPEDRTPVAAPSGLTSLDLDATGVGTVVWAPGYRCDFEWIELPVFDAGRPVHRRGVTAAAGLYFLGLPRMHKVKSAFLWGVGEDAAYLARHIAARSGRRVPGEAPEADHLI